MPVKTPLSSPAVKKPRRRKWTPTMLPSYTFETWLHAVKTQNDAIASFAIIPPSRGTKESPEEIALHTDIVDDKGHPSVRDWSKLLQPSVVTWQSQADKERAQQVYDDHHKMVQRMRNRNNTNGRRERGKERLKRKYDEMTPEAKKERFREGDKKKAAMKDKRRKEGVKKCDQGNRGCGEILPLAWCRAASSATPPKASVIYTSFSKCVTTFRSTRRRAFRPRLLCRVFIRTSTSVRNNTVLLGALKRMYLEHLYESYRSSYRRLSLTRLR